MSDQHGAGLDMALELDYPSIGQPIAGMRQELSRAGRFQIHQLHGDRNRDLQLAIRREVARAIG
ncbi:MAG: hypothetical protein ACKOCD_11095 [Nitrospiraceae bacterium]